MAKKKHISAVITLKDNFSAGLRGVRREQRSFQKEVAQTRKAMDSINKKKMTARLNATQANKAFQALKKNVKYIEAKKKLVQTIVAKDMALAKIKKVQSAMKSVGKMVAKPILAAKDKASSIIKGIGGKLGALAKGVAIPVAIATTAVGATVKSGMDLERQQISMNHFMGVGNKDKSQAEIDKMSATYLNNLRNNANATPFETGEVISAGTRALQIAGGNSKEAMNLVKLAEDMAALNPNKTVGDAMEALADMNMGEYARLTEFGVKATKEGGDTPQSVQAELQKMYAGGAEKLATSGAGLWSTIMGKLKSSLSDIGLGMLEPLKPVMTDIIGFIDQATPGILAIGQAITGGLATGITWIREQMPTIGPIFSTIFSSMGSIVTTVAPIIGQAIIALSPIFNGLLGVVSGVMQGVSGAVQIAAPIVSGLISSLSPIFSNVGNALKSLGDIFNSVFRGIMSIVEKAYNFVKPLIDGIGSIVSGVSGAISSGLGWVANKLNIGKNATGTKYWGGGLSLVGEHGPELVQMPNGSKVYTNTETNSILNQQPRTKASKTSSSNSIYLNISKLADHIIVREEADIDKLTDKITSNLVKKINQNVVVFGG